MRWRSSYGLAILLAGSGILFAWYQAIPTFADPDSYYHVRFTALMLQHGFISDFPWLPLTTLGQAFADHHLLYHMLLLPGVTLLGPVIGAKVTQALLCLAVVLTGYVILRRWHMPYAAAGVAALLTSYPMLVRLSLVKASAVAVILFLLVFMTLVERRYGWAAILTLLYSLAHGGFPLALVLAVVVWGVQLITASLRNDKYVPLQPTGIVLVGAAMVIGVIVNPYFPNNIAFLWAQFFQIGVVNYRNVISVGAEWYPFALPDLIAAISLLGMGFVLAVAVIATQVRKLSQDVATLSVVVLLPIFFALTLRSRRFVEYLVPVLWLLVCVVVLPAIKDGVLQRWWHTLVRMLGKKLMLGVTTYVLMASLFGVGLVLVSVANSFWHQPALDRLDAAGAYLQTVVGPSDMVFHGSWDDFPQLFYANPQAAYIVGLDPTFLYLANQDTYTDWKEISDGQKKQSTAAAVIELFQSRYVVIDETDERTKLMLAYLLRDPKAETVFQQNDIRIFHLNP